MTSLPPRPRMQLLPLPALMTSAPAVPLMMLVPAGQQEASSPSTAVTRWVPVATLPAPSRAVQVTVVVPSGKVAGLLLVMVTGPTRSVALAVPIAALVQTEMVMSGGTVIAGGTVSATVTVKVLVVPFPLLSRALQVTVVVPGGKRLPLAGVQPTPSAPETTSVAVAVKVTTAV